MKKNYNKKTNAIEILNLEGPLNNTPFYSTFFDIEFDPDYLRDLADTIDKNNLTDKYQIIFRRCPVDWSDRYDKVIQDYSEIIYEINPIWKSNSIGWNSYVPLIEDTLLYSWILRFCDIVYTFL